eukprot:m.449724 g.449724  ORF g.449724 m.449724 type:complete len:63 (-) comp19865_c0_seq1:1515-1703(-)
MWVDQRSSAVSPHNLFERDLLAADPGGEVDTIEEREPRNDKEHEDLPRCPPRDTASRPDRKE